MTTKNNLVKVNDIIFLREGKDDKKISFDSLGKAILPFNKNLDEGFYKVKKSVEKENYYFVDLEKIIYDAYHEMSVEEFIEVGKKWGYKLGFNEEYERNGNKENFILLYNLDNGNICKGETFTRTYKDKTRKVFNTIEIFIHNKSSLISSLLNRELCYYTNGNCVGLKIINDLEIRDNQSIFETAENLVKSPNYLGKIWNGYEDFFLWNNLDEENYSFKELNSISRNKILKCPSDIKEILKNNEAYKDILK